MLPQKKTTHTKLSYYFIFKVYRLSITEESLTRHFVSFRWNKNPPYPAIMENSNILKPSYFITIPIDPQCIYSMQLHDVLIQKIISGASWVPLPLKENLWISLVLAFFRFPADYNFCTITSFSSLLQSCDDYSIEWLTLCAFIYECALISIWDLKHIEFI